MKKKDDTKKEAIEGGRKRRKEGRKEGRMDA
jgi:hypothetical protein